MGYTATVLADSIGPNKIRLTTLSVEIPRIVLAELNTHRVFSRNSASSRAIPVEKMIARVVDDPFIPDAWGRNRPGMQATEDLSPDEAEAARADWLAARDAAVDATRRLMERGVHKQIVNRLIEPFLWTTVIITATEWDNFFSLRRHKDAQPEIRRAADAMWTAMGESTPTALELGDAHLPLCPDLPVLRAEGYSLEIICKIAAARCARVSYLTHEGKRSPPADLVLANRLRLSGHMSPFEHVAFASDSLDWSGNFRGWCQYRKDLPDEAVFPGEPDGPQTLTQRWIRWTGQSRLS